MFQRAVVRRTRETPWTPLHVEVGNWPRPPLGHRRAWLSSGRHAASCRRPHNSSQKVVQVTGLFMSAVRHVIILQRLDDPDDGKPAEAHYDWRRFSAGPGHEPTAATVGGRHHRGPSVGAGVSADVEAKHRSGSCLRRKKNGQNQRFEIPRSSHLEFAGVRSGTGRDRIVDFERLTGGVMRANGAGRSPTGPRPESVSTPEGRPSFGGGDADFFCFGGLAPSADTGRMLRG